MSFWDMIEHSSPIAMFVLIALVVSTVIVLALVLIKALAINRAKNDNRMFLNVFWNEKTVEDAASKAERFRHSPIAACFLAGTRELRKLVGGDSRNLELDEHGLANVQRAVSRTSAAEIASLEKGLGWLATIASAAPFVGLFGTVVGIMNSFQKIGEEGSADLATVAPGISEALVATAVGLAAAIPAVIAYNAFGNAVKKQSTTMDGFSQDFLNIVQRGSYIAHAPKG